MGSRRALGGLGHGAVLGLCAALMVGAFLLLRPSDDFATRASATSAGPDLEIAVSASGPWGDVADDAWALREAAPGRPVPGGVWLRAKGLRDPAASALWLRAEFAPSSLAGRIQVTAMRLGEVDLLPLWQGCGDGPLTLLALRDCASPPALPAPTAEGARFSMTLAPEQAAPNAFQGTSAGPVRFTFTLQDADEAPPLAATGTTNEPPAPPSTGSGLAPQEQAGYALASGAAALLGGWAAGSAWLLVAARRRREPE